MAQEPQRPKDGDVLITTETGLHFLSVVPYPHRLSFKNLEQATTIAIQWARANDASVWRTHDSQTFELLREKAAAAT
jgi:hypothetical protein